MCLFLVFVIQLSVTHHTSTQPADQSTISLHFLCAFSIISLWTFFKGLLTLWSLSGLHAASYGGVSESLHHTLSSHKMRLEYVLELSSGGKNRFVKVPIQTHVIFTHNVKRHHLMLWSSVACERCCTKTDFSFESSNMVFSFSHLALLKASFHSMHMRLCPWLTIIYIWWRWTAVTEQIWFLYANYQRSSIFSSWKSSFWKSQKASFKLSLRHLNYLIYCWDLKEFATVYLKTILITADHNRFSCYSLFFLHSADFNHLAIRPLKKSVIFSSSCFYFIYRKQV